MRCEFLTMGQEELVMLWQDSKQVVNRSEHTGLVADVDVGMGIEDAVEVGRAGTRRAEDNDGVRALVTCDGYARPVPGRRWAFASPPTRL